MSEPPADVIRRAVGFRGELGLGPNPGPGPGDSDAFRVADGDADGLPGTAIDAFAGRWLVLSEERPGRDLVRACLGFASSVWWKRPERDAKGAPPPVRLAGDDGPLRFLASEGGLRYWIDFGAGYSQGIFLDQRLNRAAVRARVSAGDRVLNLFSYTCGFSVAAAAGGATATSLDLSQTYLDWGRENLEANEIGPEEHYFCRGDALDWLRRWGRSGRTFHGVVADPPTFSRAGKGKTWRASADLPELVAAVAGVVERGGWALVSTNFRGMGAAEFASALRDGLTSARREARVEPGRMPPEFRGDRYLNAAWLRFED